MMLHGVLMMRLLLTLMTQPTSWSELFSITMEEFTLSQRRSNWFGSQALSVEVCEWRELKLTPLPLSPLHNVMQTIKVYIYMLTIMLQTLPLPP